MIKYSNISVAIRNIERVVNFFISPVDCSHLTYQTTFLPYEIRNYRQRYEFYEFYTRYLFLIFIVESFFISPRCSHFFIVFSLPKSHSHVIKTRIMPKANTIERKTFPRLISRMLLRWMLSSSHSTNKFPWNTYTDNNWYVGGILINTFLHFKEKFPFCLVSDSASMW